MAKPSIALAELVEKGAKDDIVRELLAQIVTRLIDFEIEQRTGAEYGERSTYEFQSCGAARTSRDFWSRGGRRKRRSSP